MPLTRRSPCKVNFVLNLLGRRPDGFHELETLFFPVAAFDELTLEASDPGVALTCSHPELPVDASNLVHRAATAFLQAAGLADRTGVRLHLDKRLPLCAGLGAGSANAAVTLLGLNELLGQPLASVDLDRLAAGLGSDVNFFLQPGPALAFGRGERIEPLPSFTALRGHALLLFHPGFGVATPWAFRELTRFPHLRDGQPGRAAAAARRFLEGDVPGGVAHWFNALEGPVLEKHPLLALHQEFLLAHGAMGARMSGSGSTTFALFASEADARSAVGPFRAAFGEAGWLEVVRLDA